MTAPPTTVSPLGTHERRARRAPLVGRLVAAGVVLAFWWGVTGVLLALQRSAHTRLAALAVAVAAGVSGLVLTTRVRRAPASARAAAGGVLAGALLWTAVSAAFYGGWVVGPDLAATASARVPGAAPSLARAAEAVAATGFSTLLAAVLLGLAVRAAGGWRQNAPPLSAAARFAPLTFGVLWAAHELAKLNVFFGVANPGAELLPAYLAPLRAYFGPTRNSALLAPSVIALAAATALAAWTAARATHPARRAGFALVAGILALAALEHALLGTRAPVGWWDMFLRWRGTP